MKPGLYTLPSRSRVGLESANQAGLSMVYPMFHRQGIGRLLWQHLLQATGSRTITVRSGLAAVLVYRSFGFTPIGEPQLNCCPAYLPMEYKR